VRSYSDMGLHGHVVRQLGTRIVQGTLAAGSTLDPDQIGVDFGVSRTVVREALKVLGAKGLVGARPRRGTFVRERSEWSLLDPDVLRWQYDQLGEPPAETLDKLAEVRLIIEPSAAALAARRRSEADLARLQAALDAMKSSEHDPAGLTESDVAFHRALLVATGNEFLAEMAMVIDAGLHVRNRFVHGHDVAMKPSLRAHATVLDAVRQRQPDEAETAMRRLLVAASRDVARLRRKSG